MPHGDDTTWIQTFSGRRFWPLDPRPEDVCIEDIAHHLALVNRYTGATKAPYSVAQHSVHVAEVVSLLGAPEHALTALLHDAAEAYFADVARPVKHSVAQLGEIEARLERCIAGRFELTYPFHEVVKRADNTLLITERRDLMAMPARPWKTYGLEPLPEVIAPWPWRKAELEFLRRFDYLWLARPLLVEA